MAKRWSKLQKRLYNLMDPSLDFQIHCAVYEMNGHAAHPGSKLPRYFVTIGKDIIFDYPADFDTASKYGFNSYPWDAEVSEISNLLECYIERPKDELMNNIAEDRWNLTDILRVCDRRIGKRSLHVIKARTTDEKILRIIKKRLGE